MLRPEALREALTVIARMDTADHYRGFDLQVDRGKLTVHFVNQMARRMRLQVVAKSGYPQQSVEALFYDVRRIVQGGRLSSLYIDGQCATG